MDGPGHRVQEESQDHMAEFRGRAQRGVYVTILMMTHTYTGTDEECTRTEG